MWCLLPLSRGGILYGVEMLPAGKRRNRLYAAVERLFAEEFAGRILPFDVESALEYPKSSLAASVSAVRSLSSTLS